MNFVLHRHLALVEAGCPLAGVGAMLPDLWRIAGLGARVVGPVPRPTAPVVERDGAAAWSAGDTVAALLGGVEHHVAADRWFHAHPAHHEGERRVKRELREAGCVAPRGALFAHPIWELCLDGALVRAQGIDAVIAGLRGDLEAARDGVRRLAAGGEAGSRDGAARARVVAIDRVLDAVCEGPWVSAYASPAGVALCVDGMRRRVGLAGLDEVERERLASAVAATQRAADEVLDDVLEARRSWRGRAALASRAAGHAGVVGASTAGASRAARASVDDLR